MSTIMPQGESMRKAIKWISEQIQNNADSNISKLINEASVRFDLSPNEGSFLINFYKDQQDKKDG
ncbi:MAG: hypothetical protein AAFP70_14875 [Calditrichota bacterium]